MITQEETEMEQIQTRIAEMKIKAAKLRKELADLEWDINFENRQYGDLLRKKLQEERKHKRKAA